LTSEFLDGGDDVGTTTGAGGGRKALDVLLADMTDAAFVVRHRRVPSARERDGHVSPTILSVSPPRSRYVRSWRRHARSCPACADVFRYLGLSVD
jgi:hypothetical protein